MLLNERAESIAHRLIAERNELRVLVHDDGVNVPVVDCGVECVGSLTAGIRLAEIATAGLANIQLASGNARIWPGPEVVIQTDQPVAACMASQYAGWKIEKDDFFALGSGPMRAAAGKEAIFDRIGFRESPSMAVGVLEARKLPTPSLCQRLAEQCDIEHRKLTLLIAPTGSLAGTIQVVARSVETALHKLFELNFDLSQVISGWGAAPLPPVAADDLAGIGRTNDAILYGGRVILWVDASDDQLAEIVAKLPSSASAVHGRPFCEIFQQHDGDFYQIDPLLFSPAWIRLNNLRSGRVFEAGAVRPEVLQKSFLT